MRIDRQRVDQASGGVRAAKPWNVAVIVRAALPACRAGSSPIFQRTSRHCPTTRVRRWILADAPASPRAMADDRRATGCGVRRSWIAMATG